MAKKYRSSRKYSYNTENKSKKTILIVVAVVLVLAIAIAALFIFGGNNGSTGTTTFSIQSLPEKTTYYVGDTPVWSGLKAVLTTPEGNSVTLSADNCTITGFDSSKPAAAQVITVKYKDYTDTFTITIQDKAEQKPDSLFVGMEFKTKPKTQYKVGESLSVEGCVLLKKYEDGSTEEMALTSNMVFDFSTAKAGTYTVKVMYVEDALRATLTYKITVTE